MNNKYGPAPKSMDFGQSIGSCLKKYAVFEGRASKSEFWPFFLIYVIASVILDFSFAATQSFVIGICHVIVSLGGALPMIAVSCRRLHDINKSGWFQIIPIYNLILWTQDSSSVYRKPVKKNIKSRKINKLPLPYIINIIIGAVFIVDIFLTFFGYLSIIGLIIFTLPFVIWFIILKMIKKYSSSYLIVFTAAYGAKTFIFFIFLINLIFS